MLASSKAVVRRSRGRPSHDQVVELESKLLDVALREFLDRGYGGTSMRRIVQAAGISKTTLYSRFASKESLFLAIVHKQIEQVAGVSVLEPASSGLHLEKGLNAYFNRVLAASLEGDLLQVNKLIYSEHHRFPELGAAASRRMRTGVEQVRDFILACADADGIPCRDARSVAEALIIMMRGYWLEIMLTKREVSAAERAQWMERAIRVFVAARAEW